MPDMIQFNAQKLAAVAVAKSCDETRYYLNGVFISGDTAVATDGHMLTKANDSEAVNPEGDHIFPVSKKAITAMKSNKAVKVKFENDTLSVLNKIGEVLYMEQSKELDATFPDYKRVIPELDFDSCKGSFAPDLLARLAATAKILITAPITLSGEDSKSPHKVQYNGQDEVFSVVMPMRK
mgnify:CR=1 FL=1